MITVIFDTFQIFRREFQARRQLLWAGLSVSALALMLPFLPTLSTWSGGDIRGLVSVALAVGAGIVLSIGFGATLFGSDLSEGRLGFFFERPVASAAIWIGRFLAVFFIVVLCEIIILAPAGLSPYNSLFIIDLLFEGLSLDTVDWLLILLAGPTLFLLVSHCVSIMIRARTAWLALDVVGLTLIGPSIWLIERPLVTYGADEAAGVVGTILAVSVFLALFSGTAASVSCGRTDLRRAHRYLSLTLWGVLGFMFGTTAAYSAWLFDVKPEDFDEYIVESCSPDGRWVEVSGEADGHLGVHRRYFISRDGQTVVPAPSKRPWSSDAVFSSSGNRAVWRNKIGRNTLSTFWQADLENVMPNPIETTITALGYATCALSPDGSRLAVLNRDILSVYELEGESLVATVRISDRPVNPVLIFENRDVIRYLRAVPDGTPWPDTKYAVGLSIIALDEGGHTTDYPAIPIEYHRSLRADPHMQYFVTGFEQHRWWDQSEDNPTELPNHVFEAATGVYKSTVEGDFMGFLADGRIWSMASATNGDLWFLAVPPEGGPLTIHNLGRFEGALNIFELPGAGIAIAYELTSQPWDHRDRSWDRIDLLDIETGARRTIGEQLATAYRTRHISCYWMGWKGLFHERSTAMFFRNGRGALLAWDPEAERLIPILGDAAED